MFYNQPLATRFGTDFIAELKSADWTSLDIAVAWVRRSALAHLTTHLANFLDSGKKIRVSVGIDLYSTTVEGLDGLLALESHGDCQTFIFHNESGHVFHPKVYLFRKGNSGKLIVGSNNLTGAGLFQNTEASLAILGSCAQDPISTAILALRNWRDTSSTLVHRLDLAFLADLQANGYVVTEAKLRKSRQKQREDRKKAKVGKTKMFGSVSAPKPAIPMSGTTAANAKVTISGTKKSVPPKSSASGQVLLMRLRVARGTQAQIPLRVLREPFFNGQLHARSVASGIDRPISFTFPIMENGVRSKTPNTAKIELPEAAGMSDPVARFVRTATEIEFEVWDSSSTQGKSIQNSLVAGLALSPARTTLTVPSNPGSSESVN